ncbi:hypothetical protein [Paenibacillus flagellatus]|uniref:Uncharacterized protein n=1 Tax=Paenibacillus flagellatus TaxID=2211139 RepID=A0A2V5KC69_9BACL|nr:hypothetical protein [Paenibacillus flagellatus]PYI57078.1 hypothetical protein DLM86_01110 [Paenibacillus flagellatus]
MVGISLYIVLTALQAMGILYLSYSVFRYKFASYWRETLFVSFTIACIVYFVRVLDLKAIVPLIMCLVMILFLWLIIRIPFLFSALMAVTGYMALIILETVVLFLFDHLKFLPQSYTLSNNPSDASFLTYANILMIATNVLLYGLSWWLYRKGYGFAFSFDSRTVQFKKETAVLLVVIVQSLIVIGMIYFSIINSHINLMIAAIVNAISLGALLYVSLRKEHSENA